MTAGVLAVIQGDRAGGLKKVAAGAAHNSPESVKKFAAGLRTLEVIPGASKFMQPIFEIASQLEEGADGGGGTLPRSDGGGDARLASRGGAGAATAGGGAAAVAAPPLDVAALDGQRVVTADTDPSRMQGGEVRLASGGKTTPCSDNPFEGACVHAMYGPFVLTDVIRTDPSCEGLFVQAGGTLEAGDRRWRLPLRSDLHGARVFIAAGDELVVGTSASDDRCGLLWFGYRPYID